MSTSSATAPDRELLVQRRRPRRVVERLVVEAVLLLLAVLATVVIAGSGPVDSRAVVWLVGGTGIGVVMLLLPVVLLRLALTRRVAVVLTAGGIGDILGPGRIPWPDIIDIRTVRRLTERQVHVTSTAGTVLLYAPRGSSWLPDPRFRADVAALRALAVRHGSRIPPSSKEQRTPFLVTGLALVALMTAAGIRAGERGVIWPSAPTASDVVAACPALQAAGLDQLWAPQTREKERDEQAHLDIGDYSYCWWAWKPGNTAEAPYIRLSATVRRHSAYLIYGATGMAATSYRNDRIAASSPIQLVPTIGDEAYMSSADDHVEIGARRANVTVTIDVDLNGPHRREAEQMGRALTSAIVSSVALSGRTNL
jgi:hypothetical protein